MHPKYPEGKELFRELSQFTAGLQGFNFQEDSFEYARICRPNKIWNYLAAGIPTIGFNPGNGIELYRDKWGVELKDINQINEINLENLPISQYRRQEVIEIQQNELKTFIQS